MEQRIYKVDKVEEAIKNVFSMEEISKVYFEEIQNGTRVIIYTGSPARVIGRKGVCLRILSYLLEKHFGMLNPNIVVRTNEVK